MDIPTILTSLGISAGGAWWLSQAWVNHGLSKDLERYKLEWQRHLQEENLNLSGEIRERVETILADRAADRDYELEARKRLYRLIGPLKFQLLIACRDASRRIEEHGLRMEYATQINSPYGSSMLYRLLRPLAISEVIERYVAYADFAVDAAAIDLLIFKRSAFCAFTEASVIANRTDADWQHETQHVFSGSLSQAAHALISNRDDDSSHVLSFHDFDVLLSADFDNPGLNSVIKILDNFTIQSKPLFWQRMVAYAHICREHIRRYGIDLRFEYKPLPIKSLLLKTEDKFVLDNIDRCQDAVEKAPLGKL